MLIKRQPGDSPRTTKPNQPCNFAFVIITVKTRLETRDSNPVDDTLSTTLLIRVLASRSGWCEKCPLWFYFVGGFLGVRRGEVGWGEG